MRLHLCKTGGKKMGARAEVGSRVGENGRNRPAVAARTEGYGGSPVRAGRAEGSEAGLSRGNQDLWDHREGWRTYCPLA